MSNIEQLESDLKALNDERAIIGERAKAIAAELDKLRTAKAVEDDLAAIERKHNVQLVRPEGIQSAEAVNGQ